MFVPLAWASGGPAGRSLCGGTLRATGDAGGAAGGKVRNTEAQTNNRECPANGRSSSAFDFRVGFQFPCRRRGKMRPPPVSQSVTRSYNFAFGVAEISPTPPCSAASFEVNSEPHTGARPSVRLCVGLKIVKHIEVEVVRAEL